MNTPSITLNKFSGLPHGRFWFTALGALLLCAGAAQAAEPQPPVAERPLDLSVKHDANALQAWRHKHTLERLNSKPYGSGYEARGLDGRNNNGADATLLPANPTAGKGSTGSGGTSAGGSSGGSGGSGGAGGRGR